MRSPSASSGTPDRRGVPNGRVREQVVLDLVAATFSPPRLITSLIRPDDDQVPGGQAPHQVAAAVEAVRR